MRLTRLHKLRGLVLAAALLPAALLLVGCEARAGTAVPYDLQFIDALTAHHKIEIALTAPAKANAMDPRVSDLAEMIDEARSFEIALVADWRDKWFPDKPPTQAATSMPGMAVAMRNADPGRLASLKGTDFDQAFVEAMIPLHKGALALAKDALVRGQHQEIRDLAQRIIDVQQAEVDTMSRWQTEWTGAR
jgi:uncharacterized protein (DUF305 family)